MDRCFPAARTIQEFTPIHTKKILRFPINDTSRIPLTVLLILLGVIISANSTRIAAQSRARPAPKSLLTELEKEDRNCVVNNGGLMKNVTVESIKLSSKSPQILVKGSGLCLCGAQNCGFWIYQQPGNKARLLLKGAGATKVTAGRYSSKGLRDVISESHASAIEKVIRTYRYDGSRYQLQKCVNRAYYDNSGKPTSLPVERPCEEKPKLQ